MKTFAFNKIFVLAALAVAPLMASESFGGIGVSIYQSYDGVKIAEIIPGTPAAESNMRAGDVIVAVDGEHHRLVGQLHFNMLALNF